MTTYELERLLNEYFGKLSERERRIAVRSVELYRDRMLSHWNELRERAAIVAMRGILSNSSVPKIPKLAEEYQCTADLAVGYADALIEELKKEK